jgi:hypothetical protein
MKPEKNEEGLYIVRSVAQLEQVKDETFVYAICHKCKGGWVSLVVNAEKILTYGCIGCAGDEWIPVPDVIEQEIFKRGDKVNFKGNKNYRAIKGTYVWAVNPHLCIEYVIEHPDGKTKDYFINNANDGFECIPSKELDCKLKYIYVGLNEIKKSNDAKKNTEIS